MTKKPLPCAGDLDPGRWAKTGPKTDGGFDVTHDVATKGQLVFDREDADNSPLIVIDPTPRFDELPPDTKEIIRETKANSAYAIGSDTLCPEVQYFDRDGSDSTYHFPVGRLYAPIPTEVTFDYPPAVWAQALLVADLFDDWPITDISLMENAVPGRVILCAKEILANRGKRLDLDADTYYTEQTTCPKCTADIAYAAGGIGGSGDSVASAYIECSECEWAAKELWVHAQTTTEAETEEIK